MKTVFNRLAKTMAVAAFLFVSFTVSAFTPTGVNSFLVKQFQQQFAGASGVVWKTTSQFTSASFVQDGQTVAVFYNPGNELVGVSRVITVNELPKKTQQTLNTRYSNNVLVSIISFVDAEGATTYYIQLENNNQQSILQADASGSISNFQR